MLFKCKVVDYILQICYRRPVRNLTDCIVSRALLTHHLSFVSSAPILPEYASACQIKFVELPHTHCQNNKTCSKWQGSLSNDEGNDSTEIIWQDYKRWSCRWSGISPVLRVSYPVQDLQLSHLAMSLSLEVSKCNSS